MTTTAAALAAYADAAPPDLAAEIARTREALAAVRAATARSLSFALERLDAGDVATARDALGDLLALHAGRAPVGTLQ